MSGERNDKSRDSSNKNQEDVFKNDDIVYLSTNRHKMQKTDGDNIHVGRVRDLLLILVQHVGELAAAFTSDPWAGTESLHGNIYSDLHKISDELHINLVDMAFVRIKQLERTYAIGRRTPVPPRWTGTMGQGRNFVSLTHMETIYTPKRQITTPNDPKAFLDAMPRIQSMILDFMDDRHYSVRETAKGLIMLVVSECAQLCEVFIAYRDDEEEMVYKRETKWMAEEEIADIVLSLLRLSWKEEEERQKRLEKMRDEEERARIERKREHQIIDGKKYDVA